MEIIYAGYGIHNSTCNATNAVTNAYNNNERTFLANNNWCGDPAPGKHKSLYIIWRIDGGNPHSGVTPEGDNQGITLPDNGTAIPPPIGD